MAIIKLARFEVKPEAREQAERAMHEFAMYVRQELDDSSWTTYRDASAPNRYVSLIHAQTEAADQRHREAEGTKAFVAALHPLLVGQVELSQYELVTSSDLAPRHRDSARPRDGGSPRHRRRLGR